MRLLVKAGADVLASNKFGYTSLLEAAGYDQSENIKMLLSLGAVLMVRAKNGYTHSMLQQSMETPSLLIFFFKLVLKRMQRMKTGRHLGTLLRKILD